MKASLVGRLVLVMGISLLMMVSAPGASAAKAAGGMDIEPTLSDGSGVSVGMAPPVASFTFSPSAPTTGNTVSFKNASTGTWETRSCAKKTPSP